MFATGPRSASALPDPDEDGRYVAQNPANYTELENTGTQPLLVKAFDGAGNTSTKQIEVSYTLAYPSVTMTGQNTSLSVL